MTAITDPLEKIIRPIVEGQIRGFLKEHPGIVNAVDWYKKRTDRTTTFTNSLGKRITLDLISDNTRNRIEAALFERWEAEKSGVEFEPAPAVASVGTLTDIVTFPDRATSSASGRGSAGIITGRAVPSHTLLPQIGWGAS